jgi:hypothetical protein
MTHRPLLQTEVMQARLLTKVCKDNDNGCWEWTEGLHRDGYAMFWNGKTTIQAHRASYFAFVGQIPAGMLVCHKCDNRKCINPDHLFIGTQADNMRDMVEKGRTKRGVNHYNHINRARFKGQNSGQSNGQARISDEMVAWIKESKQQAQEIADIFSLTRNHIYKIRNGVRRAI